MKRRAARRESLSRFSVVLYQPEIPQNTGNIARSCAVTGSDLVLVEPLGFQINDRWIKRSGMDYWEQLSPKVIDEIETLLSSEKEFYLFSTKGKRLYNEVSYGEGAHLIFGPESAGLPTTLLEKWPERVVKIPMVGGVRSLNLATSVGIALYEAWRQHSFKTQ